MTATATARDVARRLRLGRVVRGLVQHPLHALRSSIAEGGPIQQRRTELGRGEMIAAAAALAPLRQHVGLAPREIHFLSGRQHWYQTVFCFCSLHIACDENFVPVILDDGTLDAEIRDRIRGAVPWVRICDYAMLEEQVHGALPQDKYPTLHKWRKSQPLTRKLIDLHAGHRGWKMLLDSDMLFFRRPDWLMQWCRRPSKPAYMVDCTESYGYSAGLRTEICGSEDFPYRANIGFWGWRSEDTDFDWLEYAIGALVDREGPRYNITQGLVSMMLAGRECDVALASDYIVRPTLQEGRAPAAVLHHYVAHSKRSYFQHGWRHVMSRVGSGSVVQR